MKLYSGVVQYYPTLKQIMEEHKLNKLTFENLTIETTRKCNMKCAHCLRGNSQNVDIDYRYIDDNMDRIYVVRWLPRKFGGKKYFENKYALISLYEREEENKELFTFEYFEKDLEKYNGKITENSEYEILSRIVKGNLKVSREYWNKVKVRKTSFKYKNFRERKP